VSVHLHCFEYGRKHSEELKKLCKAVHYYKRETGLPYVFNTLPYIVITRTSNNLLRNLLKDDYPILFEGLHTCFFLPHPDLKNRIKIVRTHNVEHEYYRSLYEVEGNHFNKQYFRMESKKLKRYEDVLAHASAIAAISPDDFNYFSKKYTNTYYIPAFHFHEKVEIKEGFGAYVLYHGNLSVNENIQAALYLIKEVFSKINVPFRIAGKNPDSEILKAAQEFIHISVIKNPGRKEMDDLIANAHINILPTFQDTGIKLKLLNAMFSGRHCLANSLMVRNTGLEQICSIKNKPDTIIREIKKLFKLPYSKKFIEDRKRVLSDTFSNESGAKKIIGLLGF